MDRRAWKISATVAAIMVVLALVGVGLAFAHSSMALKYWIWLVPIYGLLCVLTVWLRSRHDNQPFPVKAAVRQVLHWLVVGGALWLDFYIGRAAQETGGDAGMDALMLLAVGCFLAGVHLDGLFAIVGLLLTLTLILIVKAEQYLVLVFILGALIVGLLLWGVRVFGLPQRHPAPTTEPAGHGPSEL